MTRHVVELLVLILFTGCCYNNPFVEDTFDATVALDVRAALSNPPSNLTNIQDYSFTVSGQNVTKYKYSLNGAAYSAETDVATPLALSGLTDSTYVLRLIGGSKNDDWQSTDKSTTYKWTIDSTAPVITVNGKTTAVVSPKLTGTIDDTNATLSITVNGTTYAAQISENEWSLSAGVISNLSDGSYTIAASATDTAGNIGTGTGTLVIDSTLPTATLTGTPASLTNVQTIAVTVGGTNVVSYEYKIDTGSWSSETDISSTISANGLSEGSHTLYVIGKKDVTAVWQAEDDATTYTWAIDITAPTVTVESKVTPVLSPSLSGTINDPQASVTVTVNSTTYNAVNSGSGVWTLAAGSISPDLSDGDYSVSVTAKDKAGNTGSTSATLTIDTTSTIAILNDTPDTITKSQSIAVTVSGTDATTYKYSVDTNTLDDTNNNEEIDIATPITESGLTEGSHSLYVIAKKSTEVWQSASSPTTYTWTIDLTAPTVTLSGSSVICLNLDDTYTEEGASATDNYDQDLTVTISGTVDVSTSGTYTLTYSATDDAGNTGSVTRKVVILKHTLDSTNDFDEEDLITSSTSSRSLYLDYDDEYIYIGYSGENMYVNNKVAYIAIRNEDNAENDGSATLNSLAWYEGSQVTLPFNAKYLYMAKCYINTSSGISTVERWKREYSSSDTAWGSLSTPDTYEFVQYTATSQSSSVFSKYAISRTYLGSPSGKIDIVIYMKDLAQNSGYGWIFSSAPSGATTDGTGTRTFSSYYEVDLGAGTTPTAITP